MDVLCLFGLFPKEYENEIAKDSISGMQNAANKLQWAIVSGLQEQNDVSLQVLNSLYVGSFPKKYRRANVPSFPFEIEGDQCGYNVGFMNLPGIKLLSKYFGMKEKINEWADSVNDEKKVAIAYAMTSPMVELLHYIKRTHPEIKCILVVPDLPEYMNMSNSSVMYNILKRKHIAHLKKHLKKVDGYVLLTDYMKEWFENDVQYAVVEGMYSEPFLESMDERSEEKKKVMLYSGGLHEEYGVLDLVRAFQTVNIDGWTLELIGDGSLLPSLRELAKEDDRIVIKGLLPNEQVLKRQREVSILINPRKANNVFTKYSFPSKTIEYMASGTPMVGYRLPGIPEEYYDYMYEISDEDYGLEFCLRKIMELSAEERENKGEAAKRFILNEKNSKKQCKRIIHLINKL